MEAGAACVVARALLSAAARHLLLLPAAPKGFNSSSNDPITATAEQAPDNDNHPNGCSAGAGGDCFSPGQDRQDSERRLLSHIVWRYLELGARGRVCVAAVRRTARELGGSRLGRGGGRDALPEGLRGSTAEDLARLEEGLSVGEE